MGQARLGAIVVAVLLWLPARVATAQLAPDEGRALIFLDGPINWAATTDFNNPVYNTPTEVTLTVIDVVPSLPLA